MKKSRLFDFVFIVIVSFMFGMIVQIDLVIKNQIKIERHTIYYTQHEGRSK